jgi:hypothetical protein
MMHGEMSFMKTENDFCARWWRNANKLEPKTLTQQVLLLHTQIYDFMQVLTWHFSLSIGVMMINSNRIRTVCQIKKSGTTFT